MILNSPTISGSLTVTGNIIASGSITLSGSVASASYAATASFVALAQSASNAVSAATASSADNFLVRNTLTAQTLVVQTITSSVDFVTGSTRFGSLAANTHTFTGSMSVSGSGTFVSALSGTSATFSSAMRSNGVEITNSANADILDIFQSPSALNSFIDYPSGRSLILRNKGSLGGLTLASTGAATFSTNSNSTITNVFQNTNTTDTNSRNYFNVVAGNVTTSIQSIHNDHSYINVTNNLYFQSGGSVKMTMLSGGNVGIGTSSPSALLHLAVANASVDGTKGVKITNPAGTTVMLECGVSSDSFVGTTSASDFSIRTANTERMRITAGGLTTLSGPTLSSNTQGTYALQIGEPGYNNLTLGYKQATAGYIQTWASTALYLNQQGNAAYAGAVRLDTLSDERIKDNIQPITGCLDKVLQLNGKKFHLKDEPEDKVRYGFIAQELEGILDEFVIQTDMTFTKDDLVVENVKSIENWASSWAALLVEAIKELKTQNDSLQQQINELKAQ